MKQVKLEIELSRLKDTNRKKVSLEQYSTPSTIAAKMLYYAHSEDRIRDKVVADFGSGNGIFAIGASLLGAKKVYAVEKDQSAIDVAKENSKAVGCEVEFIHSDIRDFKVHVDTVIMNPPFGSQRRDADIPFIEKALEFSKDFYILLNYKAGDFLERIIEGKGEISWDEVVEIPLVHSYDFHRKDVKTIRARMTRVKVW